MHAAASSSSGQVALESHHASARKILHGVEQQLLQLESGDTSIELQAHISQHLNALSREVQTIEELLPYAGGDKRSIWRRKVQQLQADSQRSRLALEKYATQLYQQQREVEEREALLQARGRHGHGCAWLEQEAPLVPRDGSPMGWRPPRLCAGR